MQRYWHFINQDRNLGYGDNRLVKAGRTYKVDCKPILCDKGLHASKCPLDALGYASSAIICRVELGGTIIHGDEQSVATERKVLWIADATDVLRKFARLCALDVVHLWDAPDVVVQYLKTGDESLRDAVWAAWDAAWAAWDAARAARAAARAAWGARDAVREKQPKRLHRMLLELGKDGE